MDGRRRGPALPRARRGRRLAGVGGRVDDLAAGLVLGAALFVGFPLVLWVGAIVHEGTPVRTAVLHGGDWLVKLLAIGAIVSVV